ncbi:MAG: hypothetical protein IPG38_18250 [Chitinophagaceae bacterium]|nr:hypothetical protein [Chitinophagaceae bacterium]
MEKIFRTGDKVFETDLIQDWDDRIHPEDVEKVKMMEKEIEDSTRDFLRLNAG